MKNLNVVFHPKTLAIVGASQDSRKIGHQILANVIDAGYKGEILPIHPTAQEVLGVKSYPSVKSVGKKIDLVVIAVPQPLVVAIMEECAQCGVGAVAVITSGFAEVGNFEDERKLKEIADKHNIALLGPNMFGLAYSPSNLNSSFGPKEISAGKIAFISQSGALAIGLMGWTAMEKIGLCALVNVGNKADIDEEDLISYFNEDPNVNVILIYMEGIKNGAKFLQTRIKKPTVVLKVGRSARGAQAAASHTGSIAGLDNVCEGVFKQMGILRASSFSEAFSWARALSLPKPKGEEVLIITNGGGIGVATTDECEKFNLKLLEDPQWLESKFRCTMPDFGSTKNPIDVTGQAGVEGYRRAISIALSEERIKSVIVLYCETAVTNPVNISEVIIEEFKKAGLNKPLVVAMVGGQRTRDAISLLNENQIPASTSVNEAVSSLKAVYQWKTISEKNSQDCFIEQPPQEVFEIIKNAYSENRNILLEHEARKVFELCGVPTPSWAFVNSAEQAVSEAISKNLFPLAMKIASVDIVHKTEVGGVILNIQNAQELKEQYEALMVRIKNIKPDAKILGVNLIKMVKGIECIVGLTTDPQFGESVMFGLGGVFVEAIKDVAFRVVPFDREEAKRLIYDIKSTHILEGFRGMKADIPSLVQVITSIQRIAPYVKEIDINPLLTNEAGSYAVDARIILKDFDAKIFNDLKTVTALQTI